jgi:hypothetical protein
MAPQNLPLAVSPCLPAVKTISRAICGLAVGLLMRHRLSAWNLAPQGPGFTAKRNKANRFKPLTIMELTP